MRTLSNEHPGRSERPGAAISSASAARGELEQIAPDHLDHPDVLERFWLVHAKEKDWDACVKTADLLVQSAPERPGGWIHRSYALHELNRTEEAYDQLNAAREVFSDDWLIPYNLACYLAQMGRLNEAARELYDALRINSNAVKHAAANDPDLEPLRQRIDELRSPDD